MRGGKFILDGKTPVCVGDDLMSWAKWFEAGDKARRVAFSEVEGATVSTVFLGLDHNFGAGEPLLFETMIFGGPHDQYCDRYSTWDQAEDGHAKAVALATKAVAG